MKHRGPVEAVFMTGFISSQTTTRDRGLGEQDQEQDQDHRFMSRPRRERECDQFVPVCSRRHDVSYEFNAFNQSEEPEGQRVERLHRTLQGQTQSWTRAGSTAGSELDQSRIHSWIRAESTADPELDQS
ncbi:uncharacterized protein V6R79_004957 [Siganus canaliculatus]